MSNLGTYAAALHAAHNVGDHWVQTDYQAKIKAVRHPYGWFALAGHVGSYIVVQGAAVAAVSAAQGSYPSAKRFAAALAVSAVAHGWADRREPLKRLADRLGKANFWDSTAAGIGGNYALDQAWHHATSVFVPALILTAGRGGRDGRH